MSQMECTIIGCDKPQVANGLCRLHEHIRQQHGDPLYKKPEKKCRYCHKPHYAKGLCRSCYELAHKAKRESDQTVIRCSINGCNKPHYGQGLCKKHWSRIRTAGTIDIKRVPDLPGEEWKAIGREDCLGLLISNMGRVKSIRKRDERLMTPVFETANKNAKQPSMTVKNKGGNRIVVHMEVLRAFHPNPDGDFNEVFIDGDRSNCRADNLAWYGRSYMLEKAIAMAENSDHPMADCFLKFWHGDINAIGDWLEEQKKILSTFLRSRLDRFHVPYYVDVEDAVQESMVRIFLYLRRGMLKSFHGLRSWVFQIAKTVLSTGVKDCLPAISMFSEDGENSEEAFNLIDYSGWCHPSAELQAIYNEEGYA